MKTIISMMIPLFLSINIYAQDALFAIYKDSIYVVQGIANTGTFTETKNDIKFSLMVQIEYKEIGKVKIEKLTVSLKECNNKTGKIVFQDTNNKSPYATDFVFGGASKGSYIAEIACGIAGVLVARNLEATQENKQ